MFNVGGGEILVLLLIALIFLGPDKMPDAARKVGKMLGEVRRMTSGFQEEIRTAMDLDGTADSATRVDSAARPLDAPPIVPEPSAAPTGADPTVLPSGDAGTTETAEAAESHEAPPSEPGRGDSSAA